MCYPTHYYVLAIFFVVLVLWYHFTVTIKARDLWYMWYNGGVFAVSKTGTHTIRCDDRLHAIADLLIKRHPKTLSHSWFYTEGLLKAIETAKNNGEILPDDPFTELIKINDEDMATLQENGDRLTKLQKEYHKQNSRTIAGKPAPAVPGLKPGYHFEESLDDRGNKVQTAVEDNYD